MTIHRLAPSSRALVVLPALAMSAYACTDNDPIPEPTTVAPACELAQTTFEVGDPAGHPDPFGAKDAGQARAARIDAADVAQPAHGRQRIEDGDYLLINDKIAVVIEAADLSDGYARFGGEILSVDQVGEDGRPAGKSRYVETLMGLAIEMVNPSSVTVLADGSDGGAAIVRATGPVEPIPFLNEAFGALLSRDYGFEVAVDYVLEPGAESVVIRWSVLNDRPDPVDFGVERTDSDELFGFFHANHNQFVTPEYGYQDPSGLVAWAGFDGGDWGFAWAAADGTPVEFGLEQSGFALFWGGGFIAEPCGVTTSDRVRITAGGPDLDGLRQAVLRDRGEPAWRAITGTLVDAGGAPVAGATIHELDVAGNYLSRARTNADGEFTIHAPNLEVQLVAHKRGYPADSGTTIAADATTAELSFAPHGTIHVTVTEMGTTRTPPVRVQVIPTEPLPSTPDAFGVPDEANGRLYQEFVLGGEALLPAPVGDYRVIVSRGYEWELFDTTITVDPLATTEVVVELEHSVDTTGVMCGDFHIHSFMSADSPDPVDFKVKGALADGVDIPVSSEHEWVVDFQPVIESLGAEEWAFGMASLELTTFTWGHFGVVPMTPDPSAYNNGAVDWVGKKPQQVFDQVHALPTAPVLIVNHPSGGGFGAYLSQAQFDRATGSSQSELWSEDFDLLEVFNDSGLDSNRDESVADWFAMLAHGKTVFAVGSSDSHRLRTSPIGYPRTCMRFGHDDPSLLTPSDVRDALKSGDSTINGGLMMTVTGPNGVRPGGTISGAGSHAFTVTVEAPSWLAADTLEVIVNGETVSTEPLLPLGEGTSNRYVNAVTVPFDASVPRSFVVFHATSEADLAPLHPGKNAFAVSNPIFVSAN